MLLLPRLETEETVHHSTPIAPMNMYSEKPSSATVCVDDETSEATTQETSFSSTNSLPVFTDEHTIDELIQIAHDNLLVMTPLEIATVWNKLSIQIAQGSECQISQTGYALNKRKLECRKIFQLTKLELTLFSMEELSQTIYSIALIASSLQKRDGILYEGECEAALRDLFLNRNMTPKEEIFNLFASKTVGKLHQSDAHDLSNLAYAYASIRAGDGKDLLELIAMKAMQMKSDFNAQDISMFLLAYVTGSNPNPKLLKAFPEGPRQKVTFGRFLVDRIFAFVDEFQPRELSKTVWAYARFGICHPRLFKAVAAHIVGLDNSLGRLTPEDLSTVTRAYATSQRRHKELFGKVASAAILRKDEFNSQNVANLLWACATMRIDAQLFLSFAPIVVALLDTANIHHLSIIAWSYAIADVDVPDLFNFGFVNQVTRKCSKKKDGGFDHYLCRLHQWNLWQTKEKMRPGLPTYLQEICYKAFIAAEIHSSAFQDEVVCELSSIGLEPKEEVVMDSGYSIDALVTVDGKTVGIEVDGPSHFIGKSRSPLGGTILKRRQVQAIDGIELVSLPYWDWDNIGTDTEKKQKYLRELLGLGDKKTT